MRSSLTRPLGAAQRQWRLLSLVVLPIAFFFLAVFQPENLPGWLPVAPSCGAVTGLPCIFCGTTRALHHLLHGEFGRALYYNWLAYPLLGGAIALLLLNAIELALDRNFLARLPRPQLGPAGWGGVAAGVVLLWVFQVYLAVSQHKSELLNPRGPLYSLVAR